MDKKIILWGFFLIFYTTLSQGNSKPTHIDAPKKPQSSVHVLYRDSEWHDKKPAYDYPNHSKNFTHGLYLGGAGGYGSTTWQGLVPQQENQNVALNMSTPIRVTEGGGIWGLIGGYEFNPFFALEANYMHYPNANVFFDTISLYSFEHEDQDHFMTKTETISLMGKIMLIIPRTCFRIYSSVGAAAIHRKDIILDYWRLNPSFGAGINLYSAKPWLVELGANYTAGFGESQLSPADSYIPFLYSVSLRLAYYL